MVATYNGPKILDTKVLAKGSVSRPVSYISGWVRDRKMFTNTPVTVDASAIFTRDELLSFEQWFRNETRSGADPFDIDIDLGRGVVTARVKFLTMYQTTVMDLERSRVSMNLEVLTNE